MKNFNFALVISVLALFFTIFSFWWMNWRRGKLIVVGPRSFAAFIVNNRTLTIYLPFIFFNTGAIPIIVENLNLYFSDKDDAEALVFLATVNKLGTSDGRAFATQFSVNSRESLSLICEFRGGVGDLKPKKYQIELRAKLQHSKKWRNLHLFTLDLEKNNVRENLITFDNYREGYFMG